MSNSATATVPLEATAPGGKKNSAVIFLIIGIIGLAIAAFGMVSGLQEGNGRGGLSWLLGFSFWFAILIGMLFLVQLSYIFNAGWSTIVRRQMEHFLGAFPWLMLLLLPVVALPFFVEVSATETANPGAVWKWLNLENILPGIHPVAVGEDPLYLTKADYLDQNFFFVRIFAYFVIFSGLAFLLRKHSFTNDFKPDAKHYLACRKISGAGLFLTPLTMTFAIFDLLMSLNYHWFSTMYGVWFFALSIRVALAATVIICFFLSTRGGLKGILNKSHYYFLASLSLAFTIFWAYISFSQFFLIYNANIPEETYWYNMRMLNVDGDYNQWWYVGLTLVFCMFLVPFLYLLSYKAKVVAKALVGICAWILFFAVIDLYYNIVPAQKAADNVLGYKTTPFISGYMVFDFAALVGIGGIVIWVAMRSMTKTYPIPIHDPHIRESISSAQ